MIQSVTAVGLCTVQARIDEIAEQARIEDSSCIGVDETLAALPWVYRRRLVLTPESLKAFSPDPLESGPLHRCSLALPRRSGRPCRWTAAWIDLTRQ